MPQLTLIPWAIVFLGVGVAVLAWIGVSVWRRSGQNGSLPQPLTSIASLTKAHGFSEADYYKIDPLEDLNLENEEPLKLRPFKAKYYLTMAIENITANDLIVMDKTYSSRIALRRQLIRDHLSEVLAWNPISTPAVVELYTYLTATYLPHRFPTLYTLHEKGLLNHITGELLPICPSSTEQALRILGENIDDEFLFLLPAQSESPEENGKYRLEAFITCFPSGFSTRQKLGLKLADIHTPVPGYAARLEKSMDRFFATLPVGKMVKRQNWSITTDKRLFAITGNHMYEDEHALRGESKEKEMVNLRETVMRCERQTVHRLPKTGAVVFAFKTYQYGIEELRDEGVGEELATAIDGLGEGNVPEILVYKRQVVWGEKVKKFLRGEISVDD
ncbi:hypothetical protein P280DRAFT_487347 [Massarina eburnea CBS 473.64]|uniref:HRQ family protein 2 n=1 Tax=Massarina eburnea CBS 473.64 TaxID=1395130 RepID=A0A6A6SAE7_9PLEO|nr:hypothetical protein P280DRAFT_487347 [Massarina eburnea CBS 473.64]